MVKSQKQDKQEDEIMENEEMESDEEIMEEKAEKLMHMLGDEDDEAEDVAFVYNEEGGKIPEEELMNNGDKQKEDDEIMADEY